MTEAATTKPARRRQRRGIAMRVQKGAIVPADLMAQAALRRKKVKVGDVVLIDMHLLRNPRFHRLVHRLGQLCVDQIDDFRNVDAHGAIKKIQLEADIHCQTMVVRADGLWQRITEWMVASVGELVRPGLVLIGGLVAGKDIPVRIPDSIAFDEMSESDFQDLWVRMCRHISETYWPELSEGQIAAMAELMPEDTH